ncbi:hypothetical protein A15D_00771 [Alcanivorax sp. MD8A]|uniref:hypothetical protein n=1 Tax=Alcanivorax sp. MD8A TaxID=1177157 RepID=UPI000C9B2C2E|nr:hypothetical protein [Alcanivorax sp. MD8A]PNE03551.1 hypothetical protein A15D_00771 [Alcanivorax sp. MD8A]
MHYRALAFGLCSLSFLNPVHAQDALPPCGSPVAVPEKPILEDYPDYTDFLLQIMKYKQASRDQAAHRQACPEDYLPEHTASTDPTVIDGPETLDSALQRTPRIPEIDYQAHRTWHDRSTSRSFVLSPLTAPVLSTERLRTLLGNAGSDEPLILPMTVVGMQLKGVNDGGNAQGLEEQTAYLQLPYEERQAQIAAFVAENRAQLDDMYTVNGLTVYLNKDDEIYLIEGIGYGPLGF